MDAYRIGVTIALANGVSPVLAIIGKDMLGLHATAGKVEQNFAGWSKALIGVGAILAGTTILGAMTKISEKAAEFTDSMLKLSTLNPAVAKMVSSGELPAKSYSIGAQLGLKASTIADVYGSIFAVVQDTKEAEDLLPFAAKYVRLQQMREPGSHPEKQMNALVRAGELSGRIYDDHGHIDPQRVKNWFDTAARLKAATHGQVNEATLLALANQAGGGSLRGLSDEGYANMAIVSQMMGGHRAGTALLSLRQQMTGVMMSRNAEAMRKYGLLDEGEYRSDGGHTILTDAAKNRLYGLVQNDPMGFVNHLVDKMEAQGITDKNTQMKVLSEILSRQTSQRMISDMLLAREQIARERRGLEQGATVEQGLSIFQNKSITANMQALSAAWNNFVVALAGPNGENMIRVLQTLTSGVNRMTDVVRGLDPSTLDSIYKGLAAVAVGLTALGVVSLATLIGAPAIITALAAALGALAALNWESIKGFVSIFEKIPVIGSTIGLFVRTMDMLINVPWQKVADALQGIYTAIAGFIDKLLGIAGKIGGMFSNPNKSGEGGGDSVGKGLNQPMNFMPGHAGPKQPQLAISLNIDGRTLAQSVSDELTALHAFATGAATPSGAGRRLGGDSHYT
jgi:hypothetical protein